MSKVKLGVNIDHVATVRNARGEIYPSPLRAALIAQKYGADSITIHLREDRRHIKDKDFLEINKKLKIPLNLELAPTKEMLKISLKHKPNYICIVPEKRSEITTEGGLNLKKNKKLIREFLKKFRAKKLEPVYLLNQIFQILKLLKKLMQIVLKFIQVNSVIY